MSRKKYIQIRCTLFFVVLFSPLALSAQSGTVEAVMEFLNKRGYEAVLNDNILSISGDASTSYSKFEIVHSKLVDDNFIKNRTEEYRIQSCTYMIRKKGISHHNFKIEDQYFIQTNCSQCSDKIFDDEQNDDCHIYKLTMLMLFDKLNAERLVW